MNTVYSPLKRSETSRSFIASYFTDINARASYSLYSSRNITKRLEYETSIGSAAIRILRQNSIGQGLIPQSAPDFTVLGWTAEQAEKFAKKAESFFELVTSDKSIDCYSISDFNALQRIAFRNILSSGDVLLHRYFEKTDHGIYPKIQVISGEWVSNPNLDSDTKKLTGGVILQNNLQVGYHILETSEDRVDTFSTKKVEKFNKGFEEYILILLDAVDASQIRGVPLLTAVREELLDLSAFRNAYITKAMIQALLSAAITKSKTTDAPSFAEKVMDSAVGSYPEGESVAGIEENVSDYSNAGSRENDGVSLQAGNIFELNEGEDIKTLESSAQGLDYKAFMDAVLDPIGSSLNVPREVLLQSYNSNYSASRATIAGAEKGNKILRSEFAKKFCTPVWEMVIDWGIRSEFIDAPGYFDNEMNRRAVLRATWMGPSPIVIDPTKEVQAWKIAIDERLATRDQATVSMYGSDWEATNEKLKQEEKNIEEKDNGVKD